MHSNEIDDYKKLIGEDESSEAYKIFQTMISGDENIDLKTEIRNPLEVAVLKTLAQYFEDRNLTGASSPINNLLNNFFRVMISHDRMSRLEIIESLKALSEKMIKETKELVDK